MRAGAKLVCSVCMLRKIWLEDMVELLFSLKFQRNLVTRNCTVATKRFSICSCR